MKKSDYDELQAELEKKALKRLKKKRPGMKISGSSVKKLQRIIINKAAVNKLDK